MSALTAAKMVLGATVFGVWAAGFCIWTLPYW